MNTDIPVIKENHSLKELTTFKIGGPAKYFAEVGNEQELTDALAFAKKIGTPLYVIGGGSNVLVSDNGFPGLVIHNRIRGITARIAGNLALVSAAAGEYWDDFVKLCVENNYQGVECLSGIPGTVGAAPVQNIGAYGQSVDETISEVHAINILSGEKTVFNKSQCGFDYRQSIFNSNAAREFIITNVVFSLAVKGKPEAEYHELKKYFSTGSDINPSNIRKAVLEIRSCKGLLILEGYEGFKSAGSFFKNPVVSSRQFKKIESIVQKQGCANWAWPLPSGDVKVSSACLIQCAGFTCGYVQGNVGLSPKHTLVIVNRDNAGAMEVISFARQIQEKVRDKFDVILKPEVQLVGFSSKDLLL